MRTKLDGSLVQSQPAGPGGVPGGKFDPAADGSVRFNPLHPGGSPAGVISPEDMAGKGIIQDARANSLQAATGGAGSGRSLDPAADGSVRFNPLHQGSSPAGIILPEDLTGKTSPLSPGNLAGLVEPEDLDGKLIPFRGSHEGAGQGGAPSQGVVGERTGQPGPIGDGPWAAKFNPAGQAGAATPGLQNDAGRDGVDKLFDVFSPTANDAAAGKFAYNPTQQTDETRDGVDKLFDVFNPAAREIRSKMTPDGGDTLGTAGSPGDTLGQPGPIADAARKAASKQEG